jgi:acetolactate synthase-1/2/3 large subunit
MAAVIEPRPSAPVVQSAVGTISGGQIVARMLKQEGVQHIFTISGGHIIDIYNGCLDEGIKIVDVRHEQVAAHAADAYARITGLGCAVVTAGPGTIDAVTGIANAFRAESPMLLIGCGGPLKQYKMGALQDLPHVPMMAPICKFASTVVSTERCAEMMGQALREMYGGAPGPCVSRVSARRVRWQRRRRKSALAAQLSRARCAWQRHPRIHRRPDGRSQKSPTS